MTRMRITELGDQIHGVYRELFEVSVRIIEQTLHGSVARGGKARAEHLASVAKGMELKLQYVHLVLNIRSTHSPYSRSYHQIQTLIPFPIPTIPSHSHPLHLPEINRPLLGSSPLTTQP